MLSTELSTFFSSQGFLSNRFLGVYPIDHVKAIPFQDLTFAVINTAPSYTSGEHWIAVVAYEPEFEVGQD